MQTVIKGKSFDPDNMVSSIQSEINQLGFNHYNYSNIHVDAQIDNGTFQSQGSMHDPNVYLNYQANSNSFKNPTSLELVLQIDTARLHNLHVTKDTIDLATTLNLKADDLALNNLNATLKIDSVNMTINKKRMKLDSILVMAHSEKENQILLVRSPLIDVNANGNFQYDTLVPAFMNFINRYYHISDSNYLVSNPQQITFDGTISNIP